METCLYLTQEPNWPKDGKHILASYDNKSIIVYQAYNQKIADAILKNKNLHSQECLNSGYNLNRMSWIKTNFLWMMYRSGWATKENQERILAFRIKLDGFEEILSQAVSSSQGSNKSNKVIIQWDPDHNPDGRKVKSGRRAIQLGLRGEALLKFSQEYIIDIYDMTDFIKKQDYHDLKKLEVPVEKVYLPREESVIK